jgi:hypothetical protein
VAVPGPGGGDAEPAAERPGVGRHRRGPRPGREDLERGRRVPQAPFGLGEERLGVLELPDEAVGQLDAPRRVGGEAVELRREPAGDLGQVRVPVALGPLAVGRGGRGVAGLGDRELVAEVLGGPQDGVAVGAGRVEERPEPLGDRRQVPLDRRLLLVGRPEPLEPPVDRGERILDGVPR